MYNEEYREAKRKTKLGQIVEGTSFGNYAIENKQLYENNTFIEKKLKSSKFTFAFIYNNETFGVWFDFKVGKIFVVFGIYLNAASEHFQKVHYNVTFKDFLIVSLKTVKNFTSYRHNSLKFRVTSELT